MIFPLGYSALYPGTINKFPLIKGWEGSRDLHPFSQSSILLHIQSVILLRKLPVFAHSRFLLLSFMFFLLLLWPLKILTSLMTTRCHYWSRKAHIPLLTNFKLILPIHMTFFKLLLLDGEEWTFLQLFSLCTFLYKKKIEVIEVNRQKTWNSNREQCLPRILQKRRSQSQNCFDDSHPIISPIQCIKVLIAGVRE